MLETLDLGSSVILCFLVVFIKVLSFILMTCLR